MPARCAKHIRRYLNGDFKVLRLRIAISMSVCLSVGLSVCPLAYLKKPYVKKLHLSPAAVARSSSDDNALQYTPCTLCSSSFVDDVMFSRRKINTDYRYRLGVYSVRQRIIHRDSAKLRIRQWSLLSPIALLNCVTCLKLIFLSTVLSFVIRWCKATSWFLSRESWPLEVDVHVRLL